MSPRPPLPSSVAGFVPIPIAYSSTATHILYARAHTGTKNSKGKGKAKEVAYPEGRTLFLVNVPPDATERELTVLFKAGGTVERIVFDEDREVEQLLADENDTEDEDEAMEDAEQNEDENADEEQQPRKKRKVSKEQKPVAPQVVPLPETNTRTLRRTGRTAHVVFLDASSLTRALSAPAKPRPWPLDASAPTGLARYTALYTALRPPLDVVKAHADSWMALFEFAAAQTRQRSKYKKGEAVVDDDGFTLVTRGGAYGQSVGGGVGVASKRFQETGKTSKRHRKKKEGKKEKDTFYAFQVHEKKRKGAFVVVYRWCSIEGLMYADCRIDGFEDEVGGG